MTARLAAFQQQVDDWRLDLERTPTKQPRPLLRNAIIALRGAPEWQGVLAYDEFALTTMAMKPPPWCKAEDNAWQPRAWTDHDDTLATDWLQAQGIGVRYLGAEDTPYHNEVSTRMFIAPVARIMRPGCKHDHMPILEARQGAGKSKAIKMLFEPWFTDDLAEFGSKDASMQVRSAWGIEVAELSAMTRSEIERVKAFITRSVDRFRPSYGRRVIEVPRQAVFFGSTNALEYLKDETGGRRFWPVRCGRIDHDAIVRDRDQLWAEAVALYNAEEPWWLTNEALLVEAREQQEHRYQEDPWQEFIAKYCANAGDVSVAELLEALGVERERWGQVEQNRVARCLVKLGWERYQKRLSSEVRQWRYRRAGVTGHD